MNESAFLSALHESPADVVTWLALADWLDESDQPARAEIVRLTLALRDAQMLERREVEARLAALLVSGVRPAVPEIVNGVGMRLALIPPGRCRLGTPADREHYSPDEKERDVEITRAFYLGVTPVTQTQYVAVMGANEASFWAQGRNRGMVIGLDTSSLPVDQIPWDRAVEFCQRLTQRDGRPYRLPTEAEWEYACRAGTTSSFHYGDELRPELANYDARRPGAGNGAIGGRLGRPSAVGSYPPNAFGLYDMHGNVMEWCGDWYDRLAHRRNPRQDPAGPATGQYRAVRGGCWHFPANSNRSASRNFFGPNAEDSCVGFRVVAEVG